MMNIYVYPYKSYSEGANNIVDGLSAKKLKADSSVKFRATDLVINWGNSVTPEWKDVPMLNSPQAVRGAINKALAFQLLKEAGVSIPDFTNSREEAVKWFSPKRKIKVVERHILTGHSGQGIKIKESPEELEDAKLFVRYIPKLYEFRYHVFQDSIIDIQQKRKKNGWKEHPDYSSEIRSHDRGWTFCREDMDPLPATAANEAIGAVAALGLDFGAVDLIYNGHHDKVYILEVNTSPGIEGETMFTYVNAFYSYKESM